MKEKIKEILPYLSVVIAVLLIRSFIVTPIRVVGDSMNNTLTNSDILILNKLDKSYKRFDVVVIKYENERIIKRVIGLPGDYIKYENNELYVNNKKVEENFNHAITYDFRLEEIDGISIIPDNYYFVVGDNRVSSMDSRMIGLIPKEDIEGVASIRIYPFNKIGKF